MGQHMQTTRGKNLADESVPMKIIERLERIKKVHDRRMPLVVPLYCVHQLGIDQLIEINEFCPQERPTNEVFNGRPPCILDGPTDKMERQMICLLPKCCLFSFVGA